MVIPLIGTIQAWVHLRRGTGRDPHPRARLAVFATAFVVVLGLVIGLAISGRT